VDAAVIAFHHIEGAEHEYASALERVAGAQWLRKVAFIEVHRNGRIVVRGTIAGHYVDIEDEGDLIGRDPALGAGIGVLVGLALGPPGWAAGGHTGELVGDSPGRRLGRGRRDGLGVRRNGRAPHALPPVA
jgi:hypothetical protein